MNPCPNCGTHLRPGKSCYVCPRLHLPTKSDIERETAKLRERHLAAKRGAVKCPDTGAGIREYHSGDLGGEE